MLLTKSYIYVLCDPTSSEARYVGQTSAGLTRRLSGHIREAKYKRSDPRTHKNRWILSILDRGMRPTINLIESGYWSSDELDAREIYWYEALIHWGARLTNAPVQRYGNGSRSMTLSNDVKARMSAIQTISWSRTNDQGVLRKAVLSQPKTLEHRKNIANSIKALWNDPAYVEKVRAGAAASRSSQTEKRRLNVSAEGHAAHRARGIELARARRRCSECGLVCSPGNMGRHQKTKQHAGYTDA